MSEIFISYRHDDQPGYAGRFADALASAFGADNVFRDIDDIRPGEDFVVAIEKQLQNVDVLLVMIGPGWLTASRNGIRRLDEPDDFVRLEIEAGLASGKPIIPVLVSGASMPGEAELPPALAGLARYQAVSLSDSGWSGEIERLIARLQELLPGEARKKNSGRRRWLILAGVAILILLGFAPRWLGEKSGAPSLADKAPAIAVEGRWNARVKYDWGDAYDETFEFKRLGSQLHGTATFLSRRLSIEQASLEDGWLRFVTHSQEALNNNAWKEVTHRYTGQVTAQGIHFTLESSGGYSIHPPLEFVAARAGP